MLKDCYKVSERYVILFQIVIIISLFLISFLSVLIILNSEHILLFFILFLMSLCITYKKPVRGIYLLLFLAPFFVFSDTYIGFYIPVIDFFIFGILFNWGLNILRKREFYFFKTKFDKPIILFFILSFISIIPLIIRYILLSSKVGIMTLINHLSSLMRFTFYDSQNIFYGLSVFIHLFEGILLFYFLTNNIREKKILRNLSSLMLLSFFFISLIGVINYLMSYVDTNLYLVRADSLLTFANHLATFLILFIPLSFSLFIYFKKFLTKLIFGIIFFTGLTALFLTFTRAAWLSILISFILFLAIKKPRFSLILNSKKNLFIVCFLVLSFIILFFLVPGFGEVKELGSRTFSLYTFDRLIYWSGSIDMIKDNFIFGVGLGNYRILFDNYYPLMDWAFHAHSSFFHFWAELGIFTLIVICWLIYSIINYSLKYFKFNKTDINYFFISGLFFGLLALIIYSFFEHVFFMHLMWVYFFSFIAILGLLLPDQKCMKLKFKKILLLVFLFLFILRIFTYNFDVAVFDKGGFYSDIEKINLAKEAYLELFNNSDVNDAEVYFHLASLYYRVEDFSKASDTYRLIIDEYPFFREKAYSYLLKSTDSLGNYNLVKETYFQISRLNMSDIYFCSVLRKMSYYFLNDEFSDLKFNYELFLNSCPLEKFIYQIAKHG